jgi:hypothetical protein
MSGAREDRRVPGRRFAEEAADEMAEPADGPPIIVLPERVDRRLRLGPFPSARSAVKFLAYAAVGSLLAILVGPVVGLGVIAAGFALSVLRYEDESLDRRAFAILRYLLRRPPHRTLAAVTSPSQLLRAGVYPATGGGFVAVVRAAGSPMAYLPPAEIARRFERYRELLRSEPEGLVMRVWLSPMQPSPVVPPPVAPDRADAPARDGYAALVRILCARRAVRRIDLLRRSTRSGTEGLAELESHVTRLLDRLAAFELPARRLVGRSLADAVRRLTVAPVQGRE